MVHLFQQAGYSVGIAHANFRLRGDESDGDEQFVKAFCQEQKLPFYSRRFETSAYADAHHLSIQMAARELRYDWFDELLTQEKYDKLATAHQFNDTLETILLNWIKGSSVEGLSGIPVKNNQIIRPLLFATRDEIDAYAADHHIPCREDSSNLTTHYQRNYLRHQVIPLLKTINPSLEQTVQQGLRKMTGELELLHTAFQDWKQKFVTQGQEKITIPKTALINPQQGAVLLYKLLQHLGFNFEVCANAMENLHKQSGKKFIGAAHELIIDRDLVMIVPRVDLWREVIIEPDQWKAFLGSWNMEIKAGGPEAVRVTDEYEVSLDSTRLTFPLRWRPWREGDRFYPLGMEHRKKVSDLLIDRKVPVADKLRVTVLESGGEIVWVVGHRIDNRYKITPETKRVLTFTVTPYFA